MDRNTCVFSIIMKDVWGIQSKLLEQLTTWDIKDGIKQCTDNMQGYINNGTVNDYTTFTNGYLEVNNKRYVVNHNKLIYIKPV